MPTTYIVGNDGAVSLPSGYELNVRVFAANVAYVSSDVTGFSIASGRVRRLGNIDITGSLNGTPVRAAGTPWGTGATALPSQPGGALTLSLTGGTTTSGTSAALLLFDAVFSSYAFNVDKNGESTLSVNFEMNDTNGPQIVWATS